MKKLVLVTIVAALLAPFAVGGTEANLDLYREKAKTVTSEDARGHYVLGLWCEENGLAAQARLEFEKVLALDPDHAGARQSLGYVKSGERWLSRDAAMREKGLVSHEGEWLLPEEVRLRLLPATEKERMREAQAKARGLLKSMLRGDPKVERIAAKAMEGIEDEYKVEPLAYALRYPSENVRIFAAKELGRIGDRRALRPLVYRGILDPSEPVREAAVEAVKQYGDPNVLAPFVKAMWSEDPAVRVNAEQAVGGLGDVRGVEYLLYRYRATGGGVSRNHIYLATQLSFIQDFDVEVAQTAFIADPIVGVIQEGQVLDVRVLSTEASGYFVERRVIRGSLTKLVGEDLGAEPGPWAEWWKENKDRLAKK